METNTNTHIHEKKRRSESSYTRDVVYISLFVALIVVCAWITVPYVIPFTLQILGVFLALGLLGGKRGTIAVLCYVLLGAFGVPVFSGFRGGIAVLSGVTGGYIVGFLFSALVYWGITVVLKKKLLFKVIAMIFGLIVCYAFGTAWFLFVKGNGFSPSDVGAALMLCVVPYIAFDLVKIIIAAILTKVLSPRIRLTEKTK